MKRKELKTAGTDEELLERREKCEKELWSLIWNAGIVKRSG